MKRSNLSNALLACLLAAGCSQKYDVENDSITNTTYRLMVDDKAHGAILPGSTKTIKLKSGSHTINVIGIDGGRDGVVGTPHKVKVKWYDLGRDGVQYRF